MPEYSETTAVLDLRIDSIRNSIYERRQGNQFLTLISEDGALVYCFPREYEERFALETRDGNGNLAYTQPTVAPGRYFLAPGLLHYEPAMKLYKYIRSGNDPTGSITELTAIAGQTVETLIDLERLEEEIIELLGL